MYNNAAQSIVLLVTYAVAASAAFYTASATKSVALPLCRPRATLLAVERAESSIKGIFKKLGTQLWAPATAVVISFLGITTAFVGRTLQTGFLHLEGLGRIASHYPHDGSPRGLLAFDPRLTLSQQDRGETVDYGLLQRVITFALLVSATVIAPSAKASIQKRLLTSRVKKCVKGAESAITVEVTQPHTFSDNSNGTTSSGTVDVPTENHRDGAIMSTSYADVNGPPNGSHGYGRYGLGWDTNFHDSSLDKAVAPAERPEPGIALSDAFVACACMKGRGRMRTGAIKVTARPVCGPSYYGTGLTRCTPLATAMLQKIMKLLQSAEGIPGLSEIRALFQCPCGWDIAITLCPLEAKAASVGRSRWRYKKFTSTLSRWLEELESLSHDMKYTISASFDGKTESFRHGTDEATMKSHHARLFLHADGDAQFQFAPSSDEFSLCTTEVPSPHSERSEDLSYDWSGDSVASEEGASAGLYGHSVASEEGAAAGSYGPQPMCSRYPGMAAMGSFADQPSGDSKCDDGSTEAGVCVLSQVQYAIMVQSVQAELQAFFDGQAAVDNELARQPAWHQVLNDRPC
jgi:hypothetical protein